ncbi:RCC1 domain-containing protein [Paenibacillus sp. GCM10023250]|uniref:RCC1 domain-containing protein n=1 Tax=Paenibacillus sp. GCM10023250 TaxID=3252648 RepID=UPI003607C27A
MTMRIRTRWLPGIICVLFALVAYPAAAAANSAGTIYTQEGRAPAAQTPGAAKTASLAGGCLHSLALRSDGTIWSWGDNYWGELGDGTTISRAEAVPVKSLKGVSGIAARNCNSMALLSDGTVWTWGVTIPSASDAYPYPGPAPVQVKGNFGQAFDGVIAISAGMEYYLALKSDGTVWAWGRNASGQLGDGTVSDYYDYHYSPSQVTGLDSVIAIAAGGSFGLALKSDGTVWEWGGSFDDEDNPAPRPTPFQVKGLDGVTALTAGLQHGLALRSDGSVWAWGHNDKGQLGDGTTTLRSVPVQLPGLANVVSLSAGDDHNLALDGDGTVWAWGANRSGQLGDGGTTQRLSPVRVQGLDSVTAVAAGDYHSLALRRDGTAWGWGDNQGGQLGDGSYLDSPVPVEVQGLDRQSPETLLYRVAGPILDFDATRVLFYYGKELWLYDRVNHAQIKVAEAESIYTLSRAELSAEGVVYTDRQKTSYWKDGAVRRSWEGAYLFDANGNFAVLGDSVVDLTTGSSRDLPNAAFYRDMHNRFDLSADGTVAYTLSAQPSEIYVSLPDGTMKTIGLTSPGDSAYFGVLMDGTDLLYSAVTQDSAGNTARSLRLRSSDGRVTTIATDSFASSDYAADPRQSYRIENGWIAYRTYDEAAKRWRLDVRTPDGVTKHVYTAPVGASRTDKPITILRLAPDGTIVYADQNTTYVYASQAGKVVAAFNESGELDYREHVASSQDGVEYRLLAWYLLDGSLLYGVRL